MKHMAAEIKKVLFLWRNRISLSLMQRMQSPFGFFLLCAGVAMQMFLSVVFVQVIFGFVDDLSGWNYPEAMMVVASYMLIDGLVWGTCAYLSGIGKNIKNGNMDILLVRPIDPQISVTIYRGDPEDWMRVVAALIILSLNIGNFNFSAGELAVNGFLYCFMILNAYIIIYSINVIIKSINFWIIEGNSLWLIGDTISKIAQYPTDIYIHKFVRIIFSSVLPIAFIATVPARIFIHGFDWRLVAMSSLLAFIFFAVSRKFWLFALRHYSSASS